MIQEQNKMRRELSDLVNIKIGKLQNKYNLKLIDVMFDYLSVYTRTENQYYEKHSDGFMDLFLVQKTIVLNSFSKLERLYRMRYKK